MSITARAYDFGSRQITTEIADTVITAGASPSGGTQAFIGPVSGIDVLTLVGQFIYGGGTGTAIATLYTRIGPTGVLIPIARWEFAVANRVKTFNVTGLTPKTDPGGNDSALTTEGAVDGFIGNYFELHLITTGTYTGTTEVQITGLAK